MRSKSLHRQNAMWNLHDSHFTWYFSIWISLKFILTRNSSENVIILCKDEFRWNSDENTMWNECELHVNSHEIEFYCSFHMNLTRGHFACVRMCKCKIMNFDFHTHTSIKCLQSDSYMSFTTCIIRVHWILVNDSSIYM